MLFREKKIHFNIRPMTLILTFHLIISKSDFQFMSDSKTLFYQNFNILNTKWLNNTLNQA